MKGRSYRDPHEDWVDGSWTVDCVCGVNFDDGEEMVNCDDCGVWVHTRCSRYVKGEEIFTCDKCKRKNNVTVNDSEETEVAQLLVELPTKTLSMENSCLKQRPLRLWTEIPTEEKVHVQGIPGGGPSLFEGLSSVFSRELWKCTGYVPKKFNLKYREFPSWDEEQEKDEIEDRQREDNLLAAPASALVSMRSLDGGKRSNSCWNYGEGGGMKKDKRLLRPLITSKRRNELFGASKEQRMNKDKEDYDKKGFVRKTVIRPRKDSKPEGLTSEFGMRKSQRSNKAAAAFNESIDGCDESGNTEIGEENLSHVHANGAGKQEEKADHHLRIVLKTSESYDPCVIGGKYLPENEANKEEEEEANEAKQDERDSTLADAPEDTAFDSPECSQKPKESSCDDVRGKIGSKKNKFQKEMAGKAIGTSIDSGTPSSSLADEQKLQSVDMMISEGTIGNRNKAIERNILETKPGSVLLDEPSKSCRYVRPKMVVCIGKSLSPKSDDNHKPSTFRKPSDVDANANSEDCVSSDKRDGDDEQHSEKAVVKEDSKFSMKSMLQQNQTSSYSSISKARESSKAHKMKHSVSGTLQKNEKPGQSSKNHLQSLTPKLSDEELALRLHHQLNSSPRVPRVPRMRQPGNLPLSPTTTNYKRTSDNTVFSRKKNKDASSKEALRSSSHDDDRSTRTRNSKRRRSPSRRTQQDRDENETPKTSYSSRKVLVPPNSTTSTSSGPCSSSELNEHNNLPSPQSSPRNHRTLPGLINEIMSKGKRMAYEELCNAVLPHWPHLRKHNGERYAYSTHSQAVLDCLRNRHEWARLVDRGPKTNSGKKKRKIDAGEESDEEDGSSKGGRKRLHHHSQGEEFPKGKRKARKRRRLSLQGKGIKVMRKKRNEEDEVSEEEEEEDEEGALSDTSEESVFCEEEEEEEEDEEDEEEEEVEEEGPANSTGAGAGPGPGPGPEQASTSSSGEARATSS